MENSIASAHSKGRTKLLPSSLATDPAFPTPALPTALLSGSAGRSAKKNGRKAHFLIYCVRPCTALSPLYAQHLWEVGIITLMYCEESPPSGTLTVRAAVSLAQDGKAGRSSW